MTTTLITVLLATLVLVGASMAAMAVGVMFKRPCLRGSCGGQPVLDKQGRKLSCDTCPNRQRRERHQRRQRDVTAPQDPQGSP
jgi:hypothetical protein